MQIVSSGDDLHEISNYVYCQKRKKNVINLLSAELVKVNKYFTQRYSDNMITPGKLSQVPPRRYRLNGCDRYPELRVMVKN